MSNLSEAHNRIWRGNPQPGDRALVGEADGFGGISTPEESAAQAVDKRFGSDLVLEVESFPVEVELAMTVDDIIEEFRVDGEVFQPSEDAELRIWLKEVLVRLHPDANELAVDGILQELDDFPPLVRTKEDYHLAV